jgi:hypothetical protein
LPMNTTFCLIWRPACIKSMLDQAWAPPPWQKWVRRESFLLFSPARGRGQCRYSLDGGNAFNLVHQGDP